ncbi:MAG: 2-hydroxyacyl-CoA dehydratase [Chloroflexi bacterium]|nr:2-hydroxyacyl-CoA dehydratase [Chloroflexota bacterium]
MEEDIQREKRAMTSMDFEARLAGLAKANSPESRRKHALRAKSKGKRIIGILCTYAPEEVIYAAGMLPWRVTGTWRSDTPNAVAYRDPDSCRYCTHVLESLLSRELEFLDGIVASDWDDDRRRLYDVWRFVAKPSFAFIYTVPKNKTETTERYFAKDISKLIGEMEKLSGLKIGEEELWNAVSVYNTTRALLERLYELRKRPLPPITGAEALGIVTAAQVMDKAEFNAELELLLPYIEKREPKCKAGDTRLLLSSDMLDNPLFLESIESWGCVVAMDDLDTGSRYFYGKVDSYSSDPVNALARRYCGKPPDPIAYNWEAQADQTIKWAREWRVQGVVDLYEPFSPARQWRAPIFSRKMSMAGIPFMRIPRGYDFGGIEQLRTKVDAFLEMLQK